MERILIRYTFVLGWILSLPQLGVWAEECPTPLHQLNNVRASPAVSQDSASPPPKRTKKDWSLIEFDIDDRGYNVLHFMAYRELPCGFSLWGFIDIEGSDQLGSDKDDLNRFFLEVDLKKKLWDNGGAIAEFNDLQGDANSLGRFGFFYSPKISGLSPKSGWFAGPGRIGFKVFPIQTDNSGGQASFNWNKRWDSFCDGRVSAGGFFDFNYEVPGRGNVIVTEHQVRLRVAHGLHAIVEFRVNEFLQDDFGIAPGIQYRF